MADLEICREDAADAGSCLGIDTRKTRSSYDQLIYHPHLNPLPNKGEAEGGRPCVQESERRSQESDHVLVISIRGRLNEQPH